MTDGSEHRCPRCGADVVTAAFPCLSLHSTGGAYGGGRLSVLRARPAGISGLPDTSVRERLPFEQPT